VAEADAGGVVDLVVSEESAAVRGSVAATIVRTGRDACALRLSAADGVVAPGRLESECETRLAAVQAGTADCAHQAAAEDRTATALGNALATTVNQCWSMDLVTDNLADGSSFRILTVVDQFTRECICWKPIAP
jgi:transposase InsO family protein